VLPYKIHTILTDNGIQFSAHGFEKTLENTPRGL